MFNIEQFLINQAFVTIPPDTTILNFHRNVLQVDYVVVTGDPLYIISKEECMLIQDQKPTQPIGQWLQDHHWVPSSTCRKSQLLESTLDWRRPVWVSEGDVQGIVTPEQMIPCLLKEYTEISAYFSALSETVNDAVTAVDREGRVICWNTVAEETYHIPRQNIMNRKIGEHFQRESIMLLKILDEGRPVRQIYHQPTPETHVLINASPIVENNQIIGGIATEQDITRIVRLNDELSSAVPLQVEQSDPFASIIGLGHTMKQSIYVAKKVAYIDSPVLIVGEPGSGREKLAQAIHFGGNRKGKSFLTLNCSVIPSGLLETELFGYQGGAFSGIEQTGKEGKLVQAHEGTLFIEEIQAMTLEIQGKLLDYLQHQHFYRLGSNDPIHSDTRIIASTSHDLLSLMEQGLFLQDLYFQLSVFPVKIPPLRERAEDIPEWVQMFLRELSLHYEKPVPKLDPQVMAILMNYDWPGNIQELRNVIERFILLGDDDCITMEHVPKNMLYEQENEFSSEASEDVRLKARVSEKKEAAMIEEALRKTYGNKSAAAKLLGISRGTLYNKMKEHHLL